ncbi:hypothetical protein BCR22_10915 [Enterococcus plantarum]|nr:hypothetical protein BCR22_10915 [Enterococcus plantarum]
MKSERDFMDNTNEEKKKKKRLLILLLLFLLAASAAGLYYYFSTKTEPVQVVSGDYLPDAKGAKKMSDKDLKAAEQKAVDASKFNMVIKSEAVFENGDSEGSLYIQNPIENGYPINVVIHLDSNNEQVYSSGAIQPGYEINGAKLEKKLAQGDYPATATFDIYDSKTNKKRGQVQAGITIRINN